MDSKLRERFEDLAREIPVASSMPASLPRRARRRAILTVSSVVLCGALVAVGAVAGLRSILRTDDRGPFTQPTPTLDRGRWAEIAGWITYTDDQFRPAAVDPDTSTTKLVPLDGNRNIVAWSHDGTRALIQGHWGIAILTESGKITKLTSSPLPFRVSYGSWSPDDQQVVYAETIAPSGTATSSIAIVDIDRKDAPRRIRTASDPHESFLFPTWSPDGTQIAFLVVDDRELGATSMVMDADGSSARSLTTGGQAGFWPAVWSPDSATIAFSGPEGSDGGIYTIDRDGSGLTRIVEAADAAAPAWSPDGTKIAFRVMPDDELFVVDRHGGEPRSLGVYAFKDTLVLWLTNLRGEG